MTATKPAMKMPELLIFTRAFALGLISAEVWRIAVCLGVNYAPTLSEIAPEVRITGILVGLLLCLTYIVQRGAFDVATKIGLSLRFDLLLSVCVGMWVNELASPWLANAHAVIKKADPQWGGAVLLLSCAVLASPLIQQFWPRKKKSLHSCTSYRTRKSKTRRKTC